MQRYIADQVTEMTSGVVHLPNEEMKGRIIGKEGRNIKSLEMATGMEFVIGDTPETITISGFNPIRREIAKRSLERLVQDGRINPTRIEETVAKCEEEIDELIQEYGKNVILEFNLQGVHQKDISGSGFNPVTLPFTVEVGDEFRFEGDESKTFMVNNVGLLTSIPNLPILHIILDRPISGSGINVNEFVLRRYVDSAGSFIFDGSVPSGVNSPYLIKPEYISKKLDQNIGKYIEDLTQKGLL